MKNTNHEYICFVAGHSGGHIIPCATRAKDFLKENKKLKIIFFTTKSSLDNKILDSQNFDHTRYKFTIQNVSKNPIKLLNLFFNFVYITFVSLKILNRNKPQKIVSMGGLISIPVCLAAKILKIPIELWELNVEPGKAVKFLSFLVNEINICFPETKNFFNKKKCNLSSYPIRFDHKYDENFKIEVFNSIDFDINKKTILILGGSQGSQFINNLTRDLLLTKKDILNNIQIIHQTGIHEFDWKSFYNNLNINAVVFNFDNNIQNYYYVSDLIICRAGSGTLAEVIYFKKKCITIPLQTNYTSHQLLNAQSLSKQYPKQIFVCNQNEEKSKIFKTIKNILN